MSTHNNAAPAAEGDSWPCSKCGVERSHLPACAQDECPLMLNGLTEAETNETASVKGLIGQPQPKGAANQVVWTDTAILSLMNRVGDGPFGEEDVAVTRLFMRHAEEIRPELAAAQAPAPGDAPAAHVSSLESGSPLMCGLSERDSKGLVALYTRSTPCAAVGAEGMALVPVTPTKAMVDAGRWSEYGEETSRLHDVEDDDVLAVWGRMLDAAQKEVR